MRLERITCKHLVHAWDITVSDACIIACTGRRALVLDRQYQLQQSFDGLDYVYAADVSPDGKKLLLISNGNKFYVADLETGQKQHITLRTPYNYNLEGRGCWSHDGKSLFVLAANSKTLNSALRRYRVDTLDKYESFLAEEYQLLQIYRLGDGRSYLLIGRNRAEDEFSFIHFDGENFVRYPVPGTQCRVVFDSEVDLGSGIVTLYSVEDCFRYTVKGEWIETLSHPSAKKEKLDRPDSIKKYGPSPCGRFRYIASQSGFYVADANTSQILAHVPEEYGVQNYEQVEPDVIALSTWGGVKLYRFAED